MRVICLRSRRCPPTRIKRLNLRQARAAIAGLRDDQSRKGIASNLFGNEVGNALEAVLGNIEQTFGGKKLYPSVEQRAAALLYFIIKDHAFSDGNKRIGSLLFVPLSGQERLIVQLFSKSVHTCSIICSASASMHRPI
jgi:hypothetical protein